MAKPKNDRVYSWKDIPDETINAFQEKVYELREKMIPRDCDGDIAVEVEFVDRRKERFSFFQPLPYEHNNLHGEIALSNLKTAVQDFEQHMKLIKYNKPVGEDGACETCGHKENKDA
jgi:hypothetical protein